MTVFIISMMFALGFVMLWANIRAGVSAAEYEWKQEEWACDCHLVLCARCPGRDPGCDCEHSRGDQWDL